MTQDSSPHVASRQIADIHRSWPGDVRWAVFVICIFLLHFSWSFYSACPFWAICFPFTPIASMLWPTVATCLGAMLLVKVLSSHISGLRTARLVLSIVLILLALNAWTGGDQRLFELAMRRKLAPAGGVRGLQIAVQGFLGSRATGGSEGSSGETESFPSQLLFDRNFRPFVPASPDGSPKMVRFEAGGYDMGWGLIVGRANYEFDGSYRAGEHTKNGWCKKLEPGVYLFCYGAYVN